MKTRKKHPSPPNRRHESERSFSKHTRGKGKILYGERKISIEGEDGTIYYVFHTRAIGYVHGDIVEYEITRPSKDGKLAEARPMKLIRRSEESLLMRVDIRGGKRVYSIMKELGGGIVRPESSPERTMIQGDLFIVRFREKSIVRILEYFGNEQDPKIAEEIIFFRAHVRTKWPKAVETQTIPPTPRLGSPLIAPYREALIGERNLPNTLHLDAIFESLEGENPLRKDLRIWPTITIDGADAKDLDDAISIAKFENGDFLLGVHIADVAEYVVEHTPLDDEAYLRGTSIYTPGRVIPMLPEILSNDRCSLHPGEPKLTLSLLMRIDRNGKVKESFVIESVIESRKKGVYDEIWQEIQSIAAFVKNTDRGIGGGNVYKINDRETSTQYRVATPEGFGTFDSKSTVSDSTGMLRSFYSLFKILEKRRREEGKILFETTECYFDLDEERNVKNIRKRERNDAHMMIEEFMVLANEEIAKWCSTKKIPFLSRVHDTPGGEQVKAIASILDNPGLLSRIEPRDIQKALLEASDETGHYRLSRMLLPKMAKAVYKEKVERHFGLALTHYAHFTSPIRRYPDLLLHRMIKMHLHGALSGVKSLYEKNMKKWGLSLSEKERSAEEVSRAVDALYMCRYMSDKVGEIYTGIISGVTESNVYVELESGIEGAIFLKGVNNRPDRGGMRGLTLDPIRGSLKDTKGKELYRIGDQITVKIREVDMQNRRIEMEEV